MAQRFMFFWLVSNRNFPALFSLPYHIHHYASLNCRKTNMIPQNHVMMIWSFHPNNCPLLYLSEMAHNIK
jgi:hypothetical protein